MTALRRLFAVALMVHGALHLIGVGVAWKLTETTEFPYSTEVIGGLDIGTVGMRVVGVGWLAATAALMVTALAVLRQARWALTAVVASATFSAILCLLQVDAAWRGLAIDLVLLIAATTWSLVRTTVPN